MSSYSDFANAASDILLKKGDALARGKQASGEIWGGTIARLGEVVPQQVQQVMKQAAEKRKTAQIQQVFAQSGGDLDKAIPEVMKIDPVLGQKLAKDHADVQKSVAEATKLKQDAETAQLDFSDRIWGQVHDEDSYARAALVSHRLGEQVPPQFNPDYVKQRQQAIIQQKLALQAKKTENLVPIPGPDGKPVYGTPQAGAPVYEKPAATTASTPNTVNELRIDAANPNSPTRAQSQQILDNLPESETISGPAMDERYRAIMAKPAKQRSPSDAAWASAYERQKTLGPMAMPVVIQTQQGPQLLNRRTSTTEPITSGETGETVNAPPTENQSKDASYAKRLDDAEKVFGKVGDDISKMNLLDFAAQSRMPAALQSEQFQQYDQTSRNLINSILRRESGAAISQSEFDNAKRQYLPQPGDSAAAKKLKAQNRQRQREGLVQGAGPFYTPDSERVRVKGPNGETGTVPKGTALPVGWSLR